MRIAAVVQRFGKEVLGGSEALAMSYAELLRAGHDVEVLTSCARDYVSWSNEYAPGEEEVGGVKVRRFRVDAPRNAYWFELHALLLEGIDVPSFPASPAAKTLLRERLKGWTTQLQEELVRWQGPFCSGLNEFLRSRHEMYDRIVFFTYLYPTSFYGAAEIPRDKAFLVPTLHDEPMAYLPVYRRLFRRMRRVLFLAPGERQVGRELYGDLDGAVVGMPIDRPAGGHSRRRIEAPYLFYAGRIEGGKGSAQLFSHFIDFKSSHPSDLTLVLCGHSVDVVPRRDDVLYLGLLSPEEKHAVNCGATAFIHPSPFESFGISLLESFHAGVPGLVNGTSRVLVDHCRKANAGLWYSSYREFELALQLLLNDDRLRQRLGENGRRYVRAEFRAATVRERLERALLLDGSSPDERDRTGRGSDALALEGSAGHLALPSVRRS